MKVIKYFVFLLMISSGFAVQAMDEKSGRIRYKKIKVGIKDCIEAQYKGKHAGWIIFENNKILTLEVEKKFQKAGIGSHLFIDALVIIKNKGYSKALWFASKSVSFYNRFGAMLLEVPWKLTKKEKDFSADMEFVFDRDGDPALNFKKF